MDDFASQIRALRGFAQPAPVVRPAIFGRRAAERAFRFAELAPKSTAVIVAPRVVWDDLLKVILDVRSRPPHRGRTRLVGNSIGRKSWARSVNGAMVHLLSATAFRGDMHRAKLAAPWPCDLLVTVALPLGYAEVARAAWPLAEVAALGEDCAGGAPWD